MMMVYIDHRGSAQTLLEHDTAFLHDEPISDDYQLEVLSSEYVVIGVRPQAGNDYDLEIYEDTTYSVLIESSTSVGDMVDFVALEKDAWNSPPNRGVKITSGTSDYVIEMENNIESHSVFDSWSGSINETQRNPVLDVGPPGSWDDGGVIAGSVINASGIYHMWYTGNDDNIGRIGYANSSDGITWTKYPANPVLDIGSPASWDDYQITSPTVIYNGSAYEMWYTGYDGSNQRIGYANSSDGINWTKYVANPVLDLGSFGSWDDNEINFNSVLFDGLMYHIWYSGNPGGGGSWKIGYANSTDGINWIKYSGNPVLDLGFPGSWDDETVRQPEIFHDGAIYHMWYCGNDGTTNKIGYATSMDRINWTKSPLNPVLDLGSTGEWDDTQLYFPNVIYDGQKYILWYSGYNGTTWRVGYATTQDEDGWIKYLTNPVVDLGPPTSWDEDYVAHPSVYYDGVTYHMWYSGESTINNRIGYANSTDGITWIKYPNPVVDLGPSSSWDDYHTYSPTVLYDGALFHMWYSGFDGSIWRIGYANSSDGISWTKHPTPVVDLGSPTSWDDERVYSPTVIFDGITYHMWYAGYDGSNYRMGYATSSNGIDWTRSGANPVFDVGTGGTWDDTRVFGPTVIYLENVYHMWYTGFDGSINKIGYASSADGTTWTRSVLNPILDLGSLNSWEELHVHSPSVEYDGNTLHMWYSGENATNARIGYAKYEIDWIKLSPYSEVLDAFEITGINPGVSYTIGLEVPSTSDLDMFLFNTTGGRDDAISSSINIGADIDESITFTVPLSGDYLLVITNEDGGTGNYFLSFVDDPPTITNVIVQPNPQEVSGSVNISANITDDYQLFGAWIEIYYPNGSLLGNFDLLNIQLSSGYYRERIYNMVGQYTFTIWANDTNDNWASYSNSFTIQDSLPPVISDVMATPNPQEVFGDVHISANVSDNYLVDEVWVEVHDPNGVFVDNFTMQYDSVNERYYREEPYDILGEYIFTIWAKDAGNNWVSASGTFIIQDTTPPEIPGVIVSAIMPNSQYIFGLVNISAQITDNYQLYDAWIEICDPVGGLIENVSMLKMPLSEIYYHIPTTNGLGTFTFTIWANDTSNNWASYAGVFELDDTTEPLIVNVTAVPDPQEVFGDVRISADVTDNFELDDVWVEIYDPNGDLVGNFTMSYDSINERYYLEQSYDLLGDYSFTIWANDTSNNRASAQGNFTIQDTTPPLIFEIAVEPNLQKLHAPVKISAKVTDNYQLDEVWIEIDDPDGNSIGAFPILYDSLNEIYFYNQTYEIHGEYTYTIWANDTSNNLASEPGSFEIEPESEPEEYNWKPIIALIFTVILLILGIVVVHNRPMKFTGDLSRDRWYSFFAGILPFVTAEALTGIVSFFTGLLAVPPIIGLGMIVDLVILIAGIIGCIVVYKKGVTLESYLEDLEPTPFVSPISPLLPAQEENEGLEPQEEPDTPLPEPPEPSIPPPPSLQEESQ
jgi:predicted GH43/DUF377 family glycosyl hydrolase